MSATKSVFTLTSDQSLDITDDRINNKKNVPLKGAPPPAPHDIHFHADLQSTHRAAVLSSRFNHVGVIAVEKHSTRRGGGGRRRGETERDHLLESASTVGINTQRNNGSEFNSSAAGHRSEVSVSHRKPSLLPAVFDIDAAEKT